MRFVWLMLVLAFALFTACAQKAEPGQSTSPFGVDLRLQTMDNKTVTLKELHGKVVILDLWDTWCPPCRKEIPHFITLHNKYGAKGVVILGAALGREGREAVLTFIKTAGINYTNVLASEELIKALTPIEGIPTTLVLDKKGVVYKRYVGYRDYAVFENDIKTLLAQS
jgi:thiol-disulfide isomerase/thioredoxin